MVLALDCLHKRFTVSKLDQIDAKKKLWFGYLVNESLKQRVPVHVRLRALNFGEKSFQPNNVSLKWGFKWGSAF